MGKIELKNIRKEIDCTLVNLQKLVLDEISNLFYDNKVNNITLHCREGLGIRSKYDNSKTTQIELSYNYYEYFFELYISYDQLEYFIFKEDKLIKSCNLEDFWEEDTHAKKFINFFKKDLEELKILTKNL